MIMTATFPLRTLLADPDAEALATLEAALAAHPEISVAGSATDGIQALRLSTDLDPDLVFLDPELPSLDRLSLFRGRSDDGGPLIVFTARSARQALSAFDLGAVDFLVKPLDPPRLAKCVDRIVQRLRGPVPGAKRGGREADRPDATCIVGDRLTVRDQDRIVLLDLDRIDWLEAAGNYVVIHVGNDQHVVRQSLSGLEKALDPNRFLRIHRSTIVNIDRVRDLVSDPAGGWIANLESGERLRVSRTYRRNLLGY